MNHRYFLCLLFALTEYYCIEVSNLVVADHAKPQTPVILIPPRGKYSEMRCVQQLDGRKKIATELFYWFGEVGERNKGQLQPVKDPLVLKLVTNEGGVRRFDVKAVSISFNVDASQDRIADTVGVEIRALSNAGWQFPDGQRLRVIADGSAYDCGNITRVADNETLKRTLTKNVQIFQETLFGNVPLAGAVHLAKANRSTIEIGGVPHPLEMSRMGWTGKELREARGEPPPKTSQSKSPKKVAPKKVAPATPVNSDDEIALEVGLKTALMDLLSELSDATQTRSGTRVAVDASMANTMNAKSAAERNAKQAALSEADREKREADEAKAEGSLSLAEKSIKMERFELARKLLKGLIDRYPETKARAKAEELLKSLPQ